MRSRTQARYIREMLVKHPNPMKLDEMTERLNILTKQHHSQHEVLRWIDVCSGTQPNAKDPAFLKVRRISSSVIPREYGLVWIKIAG